MKRFIVAGKSDAGTKCPENQDACFAGSTVASQGEVVFAILCDGMGGMQSGEIASASIIEKYRNWFYEKCDMGESWITDIFEIHNEWEEILEECNESIIEYGKNANIRLGSTIVMVLVTQNNVVLMNVGDSRAYFISEDVVRLSRDHSVVGKDIELGLLTEEEAKKDSRNNMLTQCVGISDEIDPFFNSFEVQNGCYVLCSDGFYNKISNNEMKNYLSGSISDAERLSFAIDGIISADREREEKDDISAIGIIVIDY